MLVTVEDLAASGSAGAHQHRWLPGAVDAFGCVTLLHVLHRVPLARRIGVWKFSSPHADPRQAVEWRGSPLLWQRYRWRATSPYDHCFRSSIHLPRELQSLWTQGPSAIARIHPRSPMSMSGMEVAGAEDLSLDEATVTSNTSGVRQCRHQLVWDCLR